MTVYYFISKFRDESRKEKREIDNNDVLEMGQALEKKGYLEKGWLEFLLDSYPNRCTNAIKQVEPGGNKFGVLKKISPEDIKELEEELEIKFEETSLMQCKNCERECKY